MSLESKLIAKVSFIPSTCDILNPANRFGGCRKRLARSPRSPSCRRAQKNATFGESFMSTTFKPTTQSASDNTSEEQYGEFSMHLRGIIRNRCPPGVKCLRVKASILPRSNGDETQFRTIEATTTSKLPLGVMSKKSTCSIRGC